MFPNSAKGTVRRPYSLPRVDGPIPQVQRLLLDVQAANATVWHSHTATQAPRRRWVLDITAVRSSRPCRAHRHRRLSRHRRRPAPAMVLAQLRLTTEMTADRGRRGHQCLPLAWVQPSSPHPGRRWTRNAGQGKASFQNDSPLPVAHLPPPLHLRLRRCPTRLQASCRHLRGTRTQPKLLRAGHLLCGPRTARKASSPACRASRSGNRYPRRGAIAQSARLRVV